MGNLAPLFVGAFPPSLNGFKPNWKGNQSFPKILPIPFGNLRRNLTLAFSVFLILMVINNLEPPKINRMNEEEKPFFPSSRNEV